MYSHIEDKNYNHLVCVILGGSEKECKLHGLAHVGEHMCLLSCFDNDESYTTFGYTCIDHAVLYFASKKQDSLYKIQSMIEDKSIVLQYVKQTYSDQMNLFITDKVLNKTLKLPMQKYDDSSIYNDVNIAITRSTQNCMGLLDSITEILYYGVEIISFIVILIYFDWKIIILSVFGALPALYVSIKANKHWFITLNTRIEKLRHIDYERYCRITEVKAYCVLQ